MAIRSVITLSEVPLLYRVGKKVSPTPPTEKLDSVTTMFPMLVSSNMTHDIVATPEPDCSVFERFGGRT